VHGILHLLGLEHGDEMERRERVILASVAATEDPT
jgi:ssRNA-specific RNase YbeY (16S rRNA maturation enzyme)